MPRVRERGGPGGPPRHDQRLAKDTDPRSHATVASGAAPVAELADWRQLGPWVAAAEHLNGLGYPAAVPASLVPALKRRDLAVWAAESRRAA